MFCGPGHYHRKFNSINSKRPWSPILILHFFQHGFLAATFLRQGCFGWDFISFLLLLPNFSFFAKIMLCNNVIWCAS